MPDGASPMPDAPAVAALPMRLPCPDTAMPLPRLGSAASPVPVPCAASLTVPACTPPMLPGPVASSAPMPVPAPLMAGLLVVVPGPVGVFDWDMGFPPQDAAMLPRHR